MNEPIKHTNLDGHIEWRLSDGTIHRTDGPAMHKPDEFKAWCQDGQLHRTDGPAVIGNDGYQAWYYRGRLHRTNGPAVIKPDESKEYWLNGIRYDPVTYLIKYYERTNQN